ncbi:helix-turn-helix transcriptional regulator [Oryzifoliimicrobium ureilyticus]|uniref:helix-turn-helix transcriptional regulator n=1 Tax=Oryzifoliimicrobium ureilyticus TaxID=3113724 RepID=UPI0030768611
MHFSEHDLEEFSDLVGLIYETVLDDGQWAEVLGKVCSFVGGSASRIYWRDATNANAETVHSWGFDPEFLDIYRRRYVSLNPLYPASVFVEPGHIFSTQNLVPPDEFQASRFFREWVLPQGFFDAAIFNIQRYHASASAFTVITGLDYGAVDDRLRYRLKLLVPHLQRAALIGRELGQRSLHVLSLEAALNRLQYGVFILDRSGRTVWANDAGAAMLTKGDVVKDRTTRLGLTHPGADVLLEEGLLPSGEAGDGLPQQQALIKMKDGEGAAWTGCLIRLPAHSATLKAFQRVEPFAHAALFLRPTEVVPASRLETCARLYGLTPAEVRVLNAAIDLDTVSKMAENLGVSTNTVKKQLSAVFDKMGVSRRTALVRAVMSIESAS